MKSTGLCWAGAASQTDFRLMLRAEQVVDRFDRVECNWWDFYKHRYPVSHR